MDCSRHLLYLFQLIIYLIATLQHVISSIYINKCERTSNKIKKETNLKTLKNDTKSLWNVFIFIISAFYFRLRCHTYAKYLIGLASLSSSINYY